MPDPASLFASSAMLLGGEGIDIGTVLDVFGTIITYGSLVALAGLGIWMVHNLLTSNKRKAQLHVNAARNLIGQSRHAEAIPHLQKALALQPDRFGTAMRLGEVWVWAEQDLPIESVLANTGRLHSTYVWIFTRMGLVYHEQGQTARAITCYQTAIRLFPDAKEAPFRALGGILGATGRSLEHNLPATLPFHPRYEETSRAFVSAAARHGHIEAAMACYRRTRESNPRLAERMREDLIFLDDSQVRMALAGELLEESLTEAELASGRRLSWDLDNDGEDTGWEDIER